MCVRCVDGVRQYFPDCPEEKIGEFLLEATAFPCSDGDYVVNQLREHRDAGCLTYQAAIARTYEEMENTGWPEEVNTDD